jgi:hypothetical protein
MRQQETVGDNLLHILHSTSENHPSIGIYLRNRQIRCKKKCPSIGYLLTQVAILLRDMKKILVNAADRSGEPAVVLVLEYALSYQCLYI